MDPSLPAPHAPLPTGSLSRTLLLGLALLASVAACSSEAEVRPRNLLMITLDTTRADHLGCYGYFRDTTPNLDRLAEESVLFERCIVPMATTLPAHISILTGTHPEEHGVLANASQGGRRFVPAPGLQSFTAVARAAGYETAAFVSALPLKQGSGAETGFEVFDQGDKKYRRGDRTVDAALEWFERRDASGAPFFLWVHLFDAHWPYRKHPEYDGLFTNDEGLEQYLAERRIPDSAPRPLANEVEDARELTNQYDVELRFQDAQMERVLAAVREAGLWDETVVLVVGDHGDGLCQHGLAAHGDSWNEQLHAPLIVRAPGLEPARIQRTVSLLGTMPTVIPLLGLSGAEAFLRASTGTDLLASPQPETVFSRDTGRERGVVLVRYTLTGERWKYFRIEHADGRVTEELYDLRADPYELEDVAAANPDVCEQWREDLLAQRAEFRRRGDELRGGGETLGPMDPELERELQSLGYGDSGGSGDSGGDE